MNVVCIIGRLTRDPEVRFLQTGTAVCKCGLAWNDRFKGSDGQWQERVHFFNFTIWGKRGEAFAKFHKKGSQASLQGSLSYESWTDKATGEQRSKIDIKVDQWHFVGNRPGGDQGGQHDRQGGGWSDRDPIDTHASQGPAPMDIDDTPF